MDQGRQRRCYAVLALVCGIVGLAGGGSFAALGVWFSVVEPAYLGRASRLWIGGWGGAGLIGIAAWLWLSGRYLRHGRAGLRDSTVWPWLGLGLGALAALAVVGISLWQAFKGSPAALMLLLIGPPVLPPAAALSFLRWR